MEPNFRSSHILGFTSNSSIAQVCFLCFSPDTELRVLLFARAGNISSIEDMDGWSVESLTQ